MLNPIFKSNFQDQISFFPVRFDKNISKDSPVRRIDQIVDKLEITKIERNYFGGSIFV